MLEVKKKKKTETFRVNIEPKFRDVFLCIAIDAILI